jgi:3-methylcrotonyl-CoA carboxylase alpha subunit
MFSSLLIANRGEIACRIIRTARAMGMRTVAVYSDADADALHVEMADEAVRLGPAPASESYLKGDFIIEAAKRTGADAIHPGYGFLAENAAFAEAVEKAGLIFVGPPPAAITAMGRKDAAKALMEKAGVPVVPGYHGDSQKADHLAKEAKRIGFPVLIKAVSGGGGKGMRRVDRVEDFAAALESAQREGQNSFGDPRVLIEKYITRPRHIEVQVFADSRGNTVHLFERDCSLQRRHQKVVEEAPAPGMPEEMRAAMGKAAVDAARAVGYRGAGTVEFIADASEGLRPDRFYFMEMNTRLQVEHPVTELITGQDLVEWQLRVAAGEALPARQDDLAIKGHAIEVRLYAENPASGFLPSIGRLERLRLATPDGFLRVDTGVREGDEVSPHYDPMIAKVIAWAPDRPQAAARLARAMRQAQITGLHTNAGFLARALSHSAFVAEEVDTGFIDRHLADLVPAAAAPTPMQKAMAALAAVRLRARRACRAVSSGDPFSPWDVADAFRVNAPGEELVRFGGEHGFLARVTREGDALRIGLDGEAISLTGQLSEEGELDAVIDGVRHRVGVMARGEGVVLFMDGEAVEFPAFDPLTFAEEHDGGGDAIRAPMPGKVISLKTKEGATVKRGEALVILEAMKMEHTLTAPRDGVIRTLSAGEGEQVAEGAVLVTFETAQA